MKVSKSVSGSDGCQPCIKALLLRIVGVKPLAFHSTSFLLVATIRAESCAAFTELLIGTVATGHPFYMV